MSKNLRVTIMLNEGNAKYIREKQASIIKKTLGTCSFSKVINDELGHAK